MPQVTVTEHLLLHQKQSPSATGRFTMLLNELILAGKIISRDVNKAGLVDIVGFTGTENIQGEKVKKLDRFANEVLIHRMERAGVLCGMASEENADLIPIRDKFPKGDYMLLFDPLDGSTNIDVNINVGTIFSILRNKNFDGSGASLSDMLRPGVEQVAAGYIMYGSSTILVYTTGNGVHGFTLDPSVGEFLLSHPNLTIPEKGKIYSVNEGYWNYWDKPTQEIVSWFKDPDGKRGAPYSLRYIGSLVADFHRTLIYGGIFMYPADNRDPAKSKGKLRLMYEASPLAMLAEQAGGMASTGTRRILDIVPEDLHQRVPLFIGSRDEVQKIQETYSKYAGCAV
ncbi:D-fructose 1,6-bisphosphatase [Desulfocurvibacter africanus PCS]|uniref:Fructose-1,6-bisphosphatase class 1 n=1 Tax=Desulfocurvibacter africanus PCS TaxID=1262666 RepID=M5PXQ1_DESAF|nr:class 1 fructose-bisphosphatase [Desulfocurvibacter africanus]EMG38755.1 D-fructose 1,6-bisphosphatase [Desulfocurvibacter africanus PCS]